MPPDTVVLGCEIEGLELALQDGRTGRSSFGEKREAREQQTWLPSEMSLATQIPKYTNKFNTQEEGPQCW